MRDISKKLTVINTGKKESEAGAASQPSGVVYVGAGGGGGGGNLNDYLLKSIWNKVWEIRTDSQGTEYIFGKLPVVTQYGITMYSGDNVDIPSIAEGLPFDNRTIWFNPKTNQIEVIGGTGGGSGEGVSNFWDLNGIPSWITNTKPTYSYTEIQGTPDLSKYALASDIPSLSGYATEQWVLGRGYALSSDLSKFIPIAGATDITGEKNFVGGIKVNGSPIYYDTDKNYWKLEGDLLVTGGVTMYGNEGTFTPSTIMDAISVDGTTISKEGGVLKVIGSVGGATTLGSLTNVGSWADSVAPQDRIMYQAANSSQWVAKNLSDLAVGGVTGNYLPLNMTSTPFVVNTQSGVVNFKSTSASEVGFRLYFGDSNKGGLWANDERIYLYHAPTGNSIALTTGGRLIFKSGSVDYTVLHSENYDNYALPLSGGVLTSSANKVLELDTTGQVEVGMRFSMSSVAKGWVGYAPSDGTILYNNASKATLGIKDDGTIHFNNNTIWHAGNDGSGSGLDADMLDGKHYSDIVNGNVASATRIQAYQYNSGEYTLISGTRTDKTFPRYIYDNGWGLCLRWQEGNGVVHNGTIATLNDNVASATKLQTARTIWGQSFDGTGNVDGALTINKATTSSGDYGACVVINGTYAETGFHRALSYENQKMAVGSTAAMYVGAKNTQYNGGFLGFKYVSANSSSNYMSIGLYAANDLLCVLGNGNVGIGTTSPSQKLHVAGNILATGGITMYSARKLKTIQDERGLSLEELSVIKPTRFTWKDGRDNRIHIGGIADDVMKVLPEVIYKTGEDDTLTMDYGNAAFAIAASLIKPVVNHEERIKMLEDENKRLKEEVEQLKWNIA